MSNQNVSHSLLKHKKFLFLNEFFQSFFPSEMTVDKEKSQLRLPLSFVKKVPYYLFNLLMAYLSWSNKKQKNEYGSPKGIFFFQDVDWCEFSKLWNRYGLILTSVKF